jgi:hypothetical protein
MRTPAFPSIFAVILLACATIGAAAETRAGAVVVPAEPPASLVDEPLGARYSLGMTLWHLGHNAQMIARFHDYLKTQGLTPEKLLAESAMEPPRTTTRLLVEPELLGQEKLGGWDIDQEWITSGAGDSGPTVSLSLQVPRAGLYRLWVQYLGHPRARGVTFMKIYRSGEEQQGPIAQPDEIYDLPAEQAGPQWHNILIDLPAGNLTVKFGHVTRWWHGPGDYDLRRIDCLYLTDELWKIAPDATARRAMRESAQPDGPQWTLTSELAAADVPAWRWWQVRPLAWEDAEAHPALFRLSRDFWQTLVAEQEARSYSEDKLPDYREPERQVVYNETWNMVANPVRAKRQIDVVTADISRQPLGYTYVWHDVGSNIEGLRADTDYQDTPHATYGHWTGGPGDLTASYGDCAGTVTTQVPVAIPGTYTMWVLSSGVNLSYTAPWFGTVTVNGKEQFKYHHQGTLPSVWMKMGEVLVEKPGDVQVDFTLDGAGAGSTYRHIHTLYLVTDSKIVPSGTVRPPWTLEMFRDRAVKAGAQPDDKLLLWLSANPYRRLSQEVWADGTTPGDSWPSTPAMGTPTKGTTPSRTLLMARDACRAVQVGLRNLTDMPLVLDVQPGPLEGQAGRFPGTVTWRAEGFIPYGGDRQAWTPFFLMRRPNITVPPLNVAGVWLTVNTRGMPSGEYTSTVRVSGAGVAEHTITLNVRVSEVAISPQQPVLVDGWTQPHEGEAYLRDFVQHGMNVWPGEMSKADMRKWGIRLLRLGLGSPNPKDVSDAIARWKALELDYTDYFVGILDEPSGTTEEALQPFLDVAKAIRAADPKVRIGFNPAEAAQLSTFQILAPYCDYWCPYTLHVFSPYYDNPQKKELYLHKPWLWYTTPCLWDKTAGDPGIRAVPSQSGHCTGVAFFALNYPWRDQWDTAYEHLPDASTMGAVASRHGPVATIVWEQIREVAQAANLAMMVRERLGAKTFGDITDSGLQQLIREGSDEELIRWLESHR